MACIFSFQRKRKNEVPKFGFSLKYFYEVVGLAILAARKCLLDGVDERLVAKRFAEQRDHLVRQSCSINFCGIAPGGNNDRNVDTTSGEMLEEFQVIGVRQRCIGDHATEPAGFARIEKVVLRCKNAHFISDAVEQRVQRMQNR